jgi:hypothetical protein
MASAATELLSCGGLAAIFEGLYGCHFSCTSEWSSCAAKDLKFEHPTGLLTELSFSPQIFSQEWILARLVRSCVDPGFETHKLLANCWPFVCKSGLSAQTGKR